MELSAVDVGIEAISERLAAGQSTSDNFVRRSALFFQKGEYRLALDDARIAQTLDSKCLEACIAAGKAASKLQRFDEAYTFYKEGLDIDPKCKIIADDLRNLQVNIIAEYEKKNKESPKESYKAVDLCSQDVYPGDDELFRNEKEILAKKYKITTYNIATVKDAAKKKAMQHGMQAHQCYVLGRGQEALQSCTLGLEEDGTNTAIRQLRAQIYMETNKYAPAMQDLWLIPKPGRSTDVWKMGGIILAKYNLPVMSEFWLRKATNTEEGRDVEAATLFQKVRVGRIYGPLTAEFPVRVDFTDYGRAVVATDNLLPDNNAFDDVPVVIGSVIDCLHLPACGHCGVSLITHQDYFHSLSEELPGDLQALAEEYWPNVTGVVCDKCDREKYCGRSCRDEAWNQYHQILCPSVNTEAGPLYDLIENKGQAYNANGKLEDIWLGQYSPIILAKIWAMIIAEAKRLMKGSGCKQPTVEQWARAKLPFRKFISFGSSSAVKKMPAVYRLMKNLFTDCGDGVVYDVTEAEFEARYYQATCNLQAFSASVTPKHVFMEKLSKLEDIRVLGMLRYLDAKPPAVSFAGMFPLHSCLNHACDNNVVVMDGFVNGRSAVHVRVRRPIKTGEELFTTYIDTSMARKLRRAWLYDSFNFWCVCKRCQFEGDDSSTCTNCEKAADNEDKKFPSCSRCKSAWYCSRKCQKQAWTKGHKSICQLDHTSVHRTVSEIAHVV